MCRYLVLFTPYEGHALHYTILHNTILEVLYYASLFTTFAPFAPSCRLPDTNTLLSLMISIIYIYHIAFVVAIIIREPSSFFILDYIIIKFYIHITSFQLKLLIHAFYT